jgi:hypothetical protein
MDELSSLETLALAFRGTSPDAVFDAMFQCILKTIVHHGTGKTDLACTHYPSPIRWEEDGRVKTSTGTKCHPRFAYPNNLIDAVSCQGSLPLRVIR